MTIVTMWENDPQRKHMEEGHSPKHWSQLIHTQKNRKGFLLYHVLTRSRGSASCRKGHSDVQHNNDVFRAVIMLSCGFRGKIFNHTFQLPDSKQEPSGIFKTGWMFSALFLLDICFVFSFSVFSHSLHFYPTSYLAQVIILLLYCHPFLFLKKIGSYLVNHLLSKASQEAGLSAPQSS